MANKNLAKNNKSWQTNIWLTKAGKQIYFKQIRKAGKQIYGKQIYD